MTRVIHTGDTHLGYQQYHSAERRRDFLRAFRRVVQDAIEDDVDAVVHAGDLFHDRRPDLPDLMGTLSVLRELDDADVPFLAIVGNHETKRDAQWLDLFASLGLATRLGAEPVVVGDAALYGLDFVPRSQRDDLAYEFESHDAEFAALVAHGLFQPFDHGDWDAEEVLAESNVPFDAMLLGDNHKPGVKRAESGAWLTYCGSTERASADEREDRGYNIVTFEEEVSIARRGIPTREFAFVDVELAEGEGFERVAERVAEYDLEDAVVVVTIEGEGDPVSPAQVEERVRERGALVARVNDHREFADDEEVEVSFADPDDAVRDRVREMGLSPAARDVDEVVRASKVPDSNVASEVESHVEELLEGGDAGAFEAATAAETAAPESTSESRTAAERMGGDGADATEGETGGPPEEPTAPPTEADAEREADDESASEPTDTADEPEDPVDTADVTDTDETADDAEDAESAAASDTAETSEPSEPSEGGDRQADWGDFS